MRKIIFILALAVCGFTANAQFPSKDSAERFINKWIRNSAIDAFTNLRLNTAMIYTLRYADSATLLSVTALNDSTLRIITKGKDTFTAVIRGVGGGSDATKVPLSRTITINGTTQDLTANRTWTLVKGDVGLGNVDNTSDVNKPVSTAQQGALDDTAAAIRSAIGSGGTPPGADQDAILNVAGSFGVATNVKISPTLNRATMDSLVAIKTRATRYAFNPTDAMKQFHADSFVVGGHSIMACNDGCPNLGFAFLIANFLGIPITNYGVPSTGDITAVSRQLLNINPGHNALTGIMPSLNNWREMDVDHSTTGPKTRAAHYNTLKSVFWNAQASNNINPTNGAGITRTGSWAINWNGATAGGKNTNLGAYTNTIGNYIEWAFTGTNAGVRVFGGDGSGSIYITPDLKVEIDGVPVDTIYTNNQTDGNDVGSVSLDSKLIPVTEVYPELASGAHTMRVTSLNAGYFLIDGFFNLLDSAQAKWQIWFHEPYMRQSGYSASALTYAKTTAMNARTDSVRGTIYSAYRERIIIGHTETLYDTSNSNDGLHPDTVGHAQIADGVIGDFVTPADGPTITYDSVSKSYTGYKDGKPYALAYAVDVANSILTTKDSVGYKVTRSPAATTNFIPVWSDGSKKILSNSNISTLGTTTTFGGVNSVFTSTIKVQGGSLSGLDIGSRGDNVSAWAIYSPGTTRDLRFFNSLGTPTDRFTFTQNGTFKIGTTVNSAEIDSRGFYSNRSIGVNKDSLSVLSVIGTNYIVTIDTTTGLFKRILPSSLGLMTNPMTTAGDLIVGGASGVPTRKAIGTSNQVFGVNNAGTAHEYKTISGGTGIDVIHTAGDISVTISSGLLAALGIDRGTYTPTTSELTNIDAITFLKVMYTKNGSIIDVDGTVTIDPTSATNTSFKFTMPPSWLPDLTVNDDITGTVNCYLIPLQNGTIEGSTSTDNALFSFTATNTGIQTHHFHLRYYYTAP